jgi:hypothetical protein
MPFMIINLAALALATCFFWWLSGFDSKLTSENGVADFIRRGVRCGVTLVLVEISFVNLWRYIEDHDPAAGFAYMVAAMPLVIIWCSCLSHMGAHAFGWLIDSEDKRPFDPRREGRVLDGIAALIRKGRKEEAIRLCESLKDTDEVSAATLAFTLEHLGVPQKDAKMTKPLAEADRLRSQGKFSEAEVVLHSVLFKNPRDMEAAMMLMRLYAQDMHQPMSAMLVLRTLEAQPRMAADHLDFARRSIEEWSNPQPEPSVELPPAGSVDELLAQGFIGTASEMLEEQVKAQPRDFDLQMKLLEVQAVHGKNFPLAEKMVRRMEKTFSPEQVEFAAARLKEWRGTVNS